MNAPRNFSSVFYLGGVSSDRPKHFWVRRKAPISGETEIIQTKKISEEDSKKIFVCETFRPRDEIFRSDAEISAEQKKQATKV